MKSFITCALVLIGIMGCGHIGTNNLAFENEIKTRFPLIKESDLTVSDNGCSRSKGAWRA